MPNDNTFGLPVDNTGMNYIEPKVQWPSELPVTTAPLSGESSFFDKLGYMVDERGLWPERLIKSGATAVRDAYTGDLPVIDPETGHSNIKAIERAVDAASLSFGGGLATGAKPKIKLTPIEYDPFGLPSPNVINATKTGPSTFSVLSETSKPGVAVGAARRLTPVEGNPFVQDVYHGSPNVFDRFRLSDASAWDTMDRRIGVHVAKDPAISGYWATKDGAQGSVYPLRIPDDSKFFDFKIDPNKIDQYEIEKLVAKTAFKKDPELLVRHLMSSRNMSAEEAEQSAKALLAGKEANVNDNKLRTLDNFVDNFGGMLFKSEDQALAARLFKEEMEKQGYVGIKYQNTGTMEFKNNPDAKDPTSYIVFDPSKHIQNRLTGTLMSETGKPGMALVAVNKATEPFYSAVERAIEGISQARMSGEQWLSTLANKPGVKPDEMQWTGLAEWLKGQNSVNKSDVQQFLANNKVGFSERWQGGQMAEDQLNEKLAHIEELENQRRAIVNQDNEIRKTIGNFQGEEKEKILATLRDLQEQYNNIGKQIGKIDQEIIRPEPRFGQYVLPGGENYRELIVTFPNTYEKAVAKHRAINAELRRLETELQKTRENGGLQTAEDAQRYVDITNKMADLNRQLDRAGEAMTPFRVEAHWPGVDNPLYHVRMNDRDMNGAKTLHVEEIQSDWHQKGRDKGYRSDTDLDKWHELDRQVIEARKQLGEIVRDHSYKIIGKTWQEYLATDPLPEDKKIILDKIETARNSDPNVIALEAKINELETARDATNPAEKVPDAPFKKSWHELALKRIVREAAENGYDRVSWTPGEAQAKRYDLSKQISSLKAVRLMGGGRENHYTLDARLKNKDENTRIAENVPESKLADYVGKEMAQKIVDDVNKGSSNLWGVKNRTSGNWSQRFYSKKEAEDFHKTLPDSIKSNSDVMEMTPKYSTEYSGLDLKVGGEGMKGFYDEIIPKSIERMFKKHGVKVKEGPLEQGNGSWSLQNKYGHYALGGKTEAEAKIMLGEKQKTQPNEGWKIVDNRQKVLYFDIPPELKKDVLEKGFPLFSGGAPVLVPVDHNPFEDK